MIVRSSLAALAIALALPLIASAQSAPSAPAAPAPAAPAPAAQPNGPQPGQHHHSHFREALRSLNLTPDQQQQIAGFARERKVANAGADAPTRHANGKHFREELAGVLTPDQRAQLHAAMVQQRTTPPQQ